MCSHIFDENTYDHVQFFADRETHGHGHGHGHDTVCFQHEGFL